MDDRHDTHDTTGSGGEFDPRAAAALLDQATTSARRQLDPAPPLMLLAGALLFPIAFGAAWWSVRHQHPYVGPTGTALLILYTIVVVWAIVAGSIFQHATGSVGGRAARQRRAEGVAFAVAWIAVYVFQGALGHAGVSHAVTYGIYPATAPLIFIGGAVATNAAAHGNWRLIGPMIALVAFGAGGAYTGPVTAWLVSGIGVSAILLVCAAVGFRTRAGVRPGA